MSDKLYNISQIKGHIYSRQPLAAGQLFLDQMTVKSGHHVNESEVRGEEIPKIQTLADRDQNFLITNEFNVRVVGGPVGSRYTKIIKFIDKASLVEISNSNGESYQVVDEDGKEITNFIDPSDNPWSNITLSDGYTIQLFAEDGTTPISINFGWTINTLNGIVHFSPEYKPGSTKWENLGFGMPVIEGFIYIGKSTTDNIESISSSLSFTQRSLENTINDAIAIQPFIFSTDQMQTIGDPYIKEISPIQNLNNPIYFQRMGISIPGYGFEVTALDRNETIVTEMRHIQETGNTEIYFDFPWDINLSAAIVRWNTEYIDNKETKVPVTGKYYFSVAAFVKNNGNKINVKEVIDLDNGSYNSNSYNINDSGWTCPTPDDIIEGSPNDAISDSSVNVNINLG